MTNLRRIVGIVLVAAAGTGVTLSVRNFRLQSDVAPRSAAQSPLVPAMVRSLRPTYPFSIIPGGAYSRRELQAQLQGDSVAQHHYSDFEVANTRLISSGQDRFAYVSYRQHGRVFWTKHKLHIPKGELLLTDGKHLARTRCGNRLTDKKPPAIDTSDTEPLADLILPTATTDFADKHITFSQPPPSDTTDTQVAETHELTLPWEPSNLPFEWKTRTQLLSGYPGSPSMSNLVAGPLYFPRKATTTTSTGGETTVVVGPPPVVPLTVIPEPRYSLLLGLGVLFFSWVHRLQRKRD